MAKITNATVVLKIARKPNEAVLANKDWVELQASTTTITHNISLTKQDMKYYGNGGETTSLITGRAQSLTISIDYDSEDPAHQYLLSLQLSQNCMDANNQYIMLQPNSAMQKSIYGKCCFQFKTGVPSGAVDEVVKIEFDIFPQDKAFTVADNIVATSWSEVSGEQ